MKKVLFVATVVKTHIMEFHLPYLQMFKENGFETAVAAKNDYEAVEDCNIPHCDTYYNIPFERNPLKPGNIKAYTSLKKIIDDGEYDIIHCHTPVGAMLARIAARKARKKGTKVIYTAHGFHFYKGAPLLNWLIYYPVEKLCAYFTDVLITINHEDYALAQKKMKAKRIEYVAGVGIDLNKFAINSSKEDATLLKKEIGIPEGAEVLLSVGEVNQNKNHRTVIEALSKISKKDIYYVICGHGPLVDEHKELAKTLGLENRVIFTGYRTDAPRFFAMADVFVFPSFREGLSVALMEAMASGLPVACSKIRGNTDLIDENGGVLFDPSSTEDCVKAITDLISNDTSKKSEYNVNKIKQFSLPTVMAEMKEIYKSVSEE